MPMMGGLGLCTALRRAAPTMPIIVATGVPPEAGDPTVVVQLESLKIARIITRPPAAGELLHLLADVIHGRNR